MFKGVLQTFRYFRFKALEFRIQYTTVPMVYGWMGLTCLPKRHPGWDNNETYMLASHDDTVLLDFSLQQDVTMVSNWLSYDSWLDLPSHDFGSYGPIDEVNLVRLFWPTHPVRAIQSTAQSVVTLQVYARFREPEVAGPIKEAFEAQSSGWGPSARDLYNAGTFMFAGMTMVNSLMSGSTSGSIPGPTDNASPNQSEASQGLELKPNPYGSLYSSPDKFVIGDGSMIPVPQRQRRNTIKEFLSKPTLIYYNIMPSTPAGQLIRVMDPYPTAIDQAGATVQPTYSRLIWMTQLFRLWRGSVKYTIVFFANAFISSRLNIILNYGDDQGGILRSEIIQDVTIRGTTRVDFVVPYLHVAPWMRTFHGDMTLENYRRYMPWLGWYWLNEPQSVGDIEPTIPILIYESAGDDFSLRSLVNPCPVLVEDSSSFVAQMKVSELRGGEVIAGGSCPPIGVNAEMYSTFEELASRWCYRAPTEETTYKIRPNVMGREGIFDFLGNTFLASSGQVKFKSVYFPSEELPYRRITARLTTGKPTWTPSEADNGVWMDQRVEDGMASIDVNLTRVLEFTVPFVCDREFIFNNTIVTPLFSSYPISYYEPSLTTDTKQTPVASEVYVSAGKDFCLYCMMPPPYVVGRWSGFYREVE